MKLLLDTHIAFWWQTGDRRLTEQVQAVVQSADQVRVSSVSLWELVIKQQLGRITIDIPLFATQVVAMGFSWLPISNRHILTVGQLPFFPDHRDPFDRLLVAQSLSEPLILITADRQLERYGSTVRRC